MARPQPLKILLVEDQTLFRQGLVYLLRDLAPEIEVTEAVGCGKMADDDEQTVETPDLVLFEPWRTNGEGHEDVENMRSRYPDARLVAISAIEDYRHIVIAIEAGADGYIPKSLGSEVFLQALRLVLAGGKFLPRKILEPHTGTVTKGAAAGYRCGSNACRLTPRQKWVMRLLAEGKCNKEIARELGLAVGTVKLHVTAVLKSLGASNRTQAVIRASALGCGCGAGVRNDGTQAAPNVAELHSTGDSWSLFPSHSPGQAD